jgi:hypothetical protein
LPKLTVVEGSSQPTTLVGEGPVADRSLVACAGEWKPKVMRRLLDGMTGRHACKREVEKTHQPGPC